MNVGCPGPTPLGSLQDEASEAEPAFG